MIRHRRLEHKFVDDIPELLEPGFVYVSMRYATAVHLCCCGCGREIVTPLSPAQWRLSFDGESISLHPSIGNWNLPCRSHYFIRNANVIEAAPWSDEEVAFGHARDRRTRTAYHAARNGSDPEVDPTGEPTPKARKGWITKIRGFLARRH